MGGWQVRPYLDSNGPDKSDGINGGQSTRELHLKPPGQHTGGLEATVLVQVRPLSPPVRGLLAVTHPGGELPASSKQ